MDKEMPYAQASKCEIKHIHLFVYGRFYNKRFSLLN